MIKRNLNDLYYFVTVAREGSFSKAAAVLGITQSTLSQAMNNIESRLGIRLLNRTTRSLSPTEAGYELLNDIGGYFDEIDVKLNSLIESKKSPHGVIRISCCDYVLRKILMPKLSPLLAQFPDVKLEFDISYELKDIVAERFDAGVRLGDTVDKDMIAFPITHPLRMAVVASKAYFDTHPKPLMPQDLLQHNCINFRLPSQGGIYAWELEKNGKKLNHKVDGQLTFNSSPHVVDAALNGMGIAFLPDIEFAPHIAEGSLIRVLDDWCPEIPGNYFYYPNRKQSTAAFALVVDALRL